MPEIKNTFTKGKMNLDLDERLVPNGEYKEALNIQVSTSDGSDIGSVQNILGNTSLETIITDASYRCVGSIGDEKNNKLYWFITNNTTSAIMEYAVIATATGTQVSEETPILVDLDNSVLDSLSLIFQRLEQTLYRYVYFHIVPVDTQQKFLLYL